MDLKSKYTIHLLCLIVEAQSEILKTNNWDKHMEVVDYINNKRKILKLEYAEYKNKLSDIITWFDQLVAILDNKKSE